LRRLCSNKCFFYLQLRAEERISELTSALVKAESDVKIEKEKMHYLKSERDDMESNKVSADYKVRC